MVRKIREDGKHSKSGDSPESPKVILFRLVPAKTGYATSKRDMKGGCGIRNSRGCGIYKKKRAFPPRSHVTNKGLILLCWHQLVEMIFKEFHTLAISCQILIEIRVI